MISRKYATSAVIAGMIAVLAIAAFASVGFSTAGTGDPHDGDEQSGNPHDAYVVVANNI